MKKAIYYLFAALACFIELIIYVLIGTLLGWQSGGGIIPMVVLLGVMAMTWKSIIGLHKKRKDGGGKSSTIHSTENSSSESYSDTNQIETQNQDKGLERFPPDASSKDQDTVDDRTGFSHDEKIKTSIAGDKEFLSSETYDSKQNEPNSDIPEPKKNTLDEEMLFNLAEKTSKKGLDRVSPPCYINLKGENKTLFFFMGNDTDENEIPKLENYKIINPESALSALMINKTIGSKIIVAEFTFEITDIFMQ